MRGEYENRPTYYGTHASSTDDNASDLRAGDEPIPRGPNIHVGNMAENLAARSTTCRTGACHELDGTTTWGDDGIPGYHHAANHQWAGYADGTPVGTLGYNAETYVRGGGRSGEWPTIGRTSREWQRSVRRQRLSSAFHCLSSAFP